MDELRKEQLQKLEAKTRELHAQMKTKFDTRMENLSALVSKLPEGHPDLLNFRRDWEMEGAADEAELKQINHLQKFLTGFNSSTAADTTITPDSTRPRAQRSTEVALPSTEDGMSTGSDTPLIFRSKRRCAPPSATPQLDQNAQLHQNTQLDLAVLKSTPLPSSPKVTGREVDQRNVTGREVDRFVDCPVIVRHAQLGWLELRCNVCRGNSQGTGDKYLLGIAGLRRHLSHKHSKTSTGTRRFDTDYVLGKCVRQLTSAEVDTYAKAIEEGRDPIVKRPCSGDDDEFTIDYAISEAGTPKRKPPVQKRPLKRSRESEPRVDGFPGSSTDILPVKRLRHGTFNSSSLAVPQSQPTKKRAARDSNMLQPARNQGDEGLIVTPVKIDSEPSCAAICHHPTKGPFILVCPFCKGNAYSPSESSKLEFLDPQTLYGHIRQAHPDALQEANSSGEPMHFSAFQGDYMALHCVDRWLATKEFEKLIKASRSGVRYSTLARKPVKVVVGDHDTKFPTLCLKHFSSVVLRDDLKWVDLRCPYCNTNKLSGYKKYRQGIKGFMLHMTKIHGFNPPDSGSSWKWLLDQCTQWSSHPEVDVRDLESGLHIIPVVPPADEKSDTLLVKLKLPSLFYENANERESVQRMQAILPTEPKAKLLTALRANKGIPDARAQAQRSYTPPTPPGFIMGTKAESEPRITIRTDGGL
ncbi:Purine permease [Venturia nashicola]|uniref:Purine permease n=1 Tax=Venturia nashicola TaxID=86259 RepID=A0A4Z1NZ61_9PEZI|nr:Purine permease [Venturia nashicola]